MGNKYIIGDLVRENIGGSIVQIINTSRYGYNFINLSNDVSGSLLDNEIEGISITPEILEKNRWKKKENYYYQLFSSKLIYLTPVANTWAVDLFDTAAISIKFVHELQHFLFGLGINSEIKV